MNVTTFHKRKLHAGFTDVGELLNSLASTRGRLWQQKLAVCNRFKGEDEIFFYMVDVYIQKVTEYRSGKI